MDRNEVMYSYVILCDLTSTGINYCIKIAVFSRMVLFANTGHLQSSEEAQDFLINA